MARVMRRIGLSLGADICWPLCYQEILERLQLAIPMQGDTITFEVRRVTIEPFDLMRPCPYDLVIDRLTHWYHTTREWIKKAVILDDLYVFNNPWSVQSMEKQTTYCGMLRLGLPVPDTWLVPPKEYDPQDDLKVTLQRYALLFDLGRVGNQIGYPFYMKPYDGGGWRGVSRIDNEDALRAAYEQSGKFVMHLQRAIEPHERFVRCVGLGPQVRVIDYAPEAALHDRYVPRACQLDAADREVLEDTTLTINAFFGWDFNSCEALLKQGVWYPIDFANPCPDSQVTSLHYHFPWLIMANIRWSIFCAATLKPMRKNLDWQPFFAAKRKGMTLRERLGAYARIARQRFEAKRFEEFCAQHLGHLDEVTREFFGTDAALDAVRQKVTAMFPRHEVEAFTQLFWNRIQEWRHGETGAPAVSSPDAGAGRSEAP